MYGSNPSPDQVAAGASGSGGDNGAGRVPAEPHVETADEPTGDPRVDMVLASLSGVGGLAISDRVAVFESAHDRLRALLVGDQSDDEAGDPPGQANPGRARTTSPPGDGDPADAPPSQPTT